MTAKTLFPLFVKLKRKMNLYSPILINTWPSNKLIAYNSITDLWNIGSILDYFRGQNVDQNYDISSPNARKTFSRSSSSYLTPLLASCTIYTTWSIAYKIIYAFGILLFIHIVKNVIGFIWSNCFKHKHEYLFRSGVGAYMPTQTQHHTTQTLLINIL